MTTTRRIAIWHDLFPGGALRVVAAQASYLCTLGHEVQVWSPVSTGEPGPTEWYDPRVTQRVVEVSEGTPRSRLDTKLRGEAGKYLDLASAHGAAAQACFQQMRDWKADLLLVHPSCWFFVPPFHAPSDIDSVIYLHEPNRSLYEAGVTNPWALPPKLSATNMLSGLRDRIRDYRSTVAMRLAVRMETEWLASYRKVLVNSRYSRESVMRAYGCDSEVAAPGVSRPVLSDRPAGPKQPMVVSLGDLSPHKGAELAIRTMAAIAPHRRPPLRWYGNRALPEYRDTMERLARTLGVDFVFIEAASDHAVTQALSEACCFLYCARLEPFGLSPLEANLAGTVVVAVGEGGVRETIVDGQNGFLAPCRSASALARRVEWLASNLDTAASLGASAREYTAEHFSLDRAGRQLADALFGDADAEAWAPSATVRRPV